MVEVWLPYGDTELSILLPDPIDLRLQSGKLASESMESRCLEKLYRVLSKLDVIRILDSFFQSDVEKNFISKILDRLEFKFEFVSSDYNVIIDIPRYDPIFLEKGSLSTYYLTLNFDSVMKKLYDNLRVSYPKDIEADVAEELLYLDIIVEEGGRLYDIYYSNDGGHWGVFWEEYKKLWGLRNDPAEVILSSVGGSPWDNSMIFIASSIIKIHDILSKEGIAIVIGDGIVGDSDLDLLLSLESESLDLDDLKLIYLRYLNKLFSKESKRIYYFGSVPSTYLKKFNVKSIRNVERVIKTIPSRMKRSISVFENLTYLYPVKLDGS